MLYPPKNGRRVFTFDAGGVLLSPWVEPPEYSSKSWDSGGTCLLGVARLPTARHLSPGFL